MICLHLRAVYYLPLRLVHWARGECMCMRHRRHLVFQWCSFLSSLNNGWDIGYWTYISRDRFLKVRQAKTTVALGNTVLNLLKKNTFCSSWLFPRLFGHLITSVQFFMMKFTLTHIKYFELSLPKIYTNQAWLTILVERCTYLDISILRIIWSGQIFQRKKLEQRLLYHWWQCMLCFDIVYQCHMS